MIAKILHEESHSSLKKTLSESILVGQSQPLPAFLEKNVAVSLIKTKLKFADDGAVAAVLLETDKSLVKRRAKKRIALKAFPIIDILWPEFCL